MDSRNSSLSESVVNQSLHTLINESIEDNEDVNHGNSESLSESFLRPASSAIHTEGEEDSLEFLSESLCNISLKESEDKMITQYKIDGDQPCSPNTSSPAIEIRVELSESLLNLSLDDAVGACETNFRPLSASTPVKRVSDQRNQNLDLHRISDPSISTSSPVDDAIDRSLSNQDLGENFQPCETVKAIKGQISPKREHISLKYKQKTDIYSATLAMRGKCCRKKCYGKLTLHFIQTCRKMYWRKSANSRRQWLFDQIWRMKTEGRTTYLPITATLYVCQIFFSRIYGISRASFFAAKKNAFNGSTIANPTSRTRRQREYTMAALFWLEKYASHYGDRLPHKNETQLSVGTLKSDVYARYGTFCEARGDTAISKSHFLKMWKRYLPTLKVKKQYDNFSKCNKCALFERALARTHDVRERNLIQERRELHLSRQMEERMDYYRKRDLARKEPEMYLSLIIDGMDQSKTFIPHFIGRKAKIIRVSDLLKTHLTAVIDHGQRKQFTFLDKGEFSHDSNMTIAIILDVLWILSKKGNPLQPTLFLQADNCWRENKNKYVMGLLEILVSLKIFQEVHLSFLHVGHTHEDIDQYFSQLANHLRRHEAETLPDLLRLLPGIQEIKSIPDFKAWMEPLLNTVSGHTQPLQFKFAYNASSTNESKVDVYYRGSCSSSWLDMGSFLKSKPTPRILNKRPPNVLPDFGGVELTTINGRITNWSKMFDPCDQSSNNWWHCFATELKNANKTERGLRQYANRGSRWHLPKFAAYNKDESEINTICAPAEQLLGQHLVQMLQAEQREPQVTVTGIERQKKKQRTK